jgi:hypothetical protein
MTPVTSGWLARVTAQSVSILVGRRVPRASVVVSVNVLNIFSQICRCRSVASSP